MRFRFVVGQSLPSLALRRLRRTFRRQGLTGFTNLTTMMYSHDIHLPELTLRRARIVPISRLGHIAVILFDLVMDGVHEDERIDSLQWPVLPGIDLRHVLFGNLAHQLRGNFHIVEALGEADTHYSERYGQCRICSCTG